MKFICISFLKSFNDPDPSIWNHIRSMCCLDPKYEKINSSIDSPVYVHGHVHSPQLSRYCTVFALEKQYCEYHCMLWHSFDLLTTHWKSRLLMLKMLKSKRLSQSFRLHCLRRDYVKFSLQLHSKMEMYGYSHSFYLKHVDYVILFGLVVVLRWIPWSDLYPVTEH